MVGLLQGVAFSHDILVCCDSVDLAESQPSVVSVSANQYSEFVAHYSRTLFAEHPDLGVSLRPRGHLYAQALTRSLAGI